MSGLKIKWSHFPKCLPSLSHITELKHIAMTPVQKLRFSLKSNLDGAGSKFQSYKMISLFNFITTLPKTSIYPKNWLISHVFIWWGNKKTICLLFLLAGHDEEQNFVSKMGVILTRSGIGQCLCVGYCDSLLSSGKLSKTEALPGRLCD